MNNRKESGQTVFKREDLNLYKIKELEDTTTIKNFNGEGKCVIDIDLAQNDSKLEEFALRISDYLENRPKNVNFFVNALKECYPDQKINPIDSKKISGLFYIKKNEKDKYEIFYEMTLDDNLNTEINELQGEQKSGDDQEINSLRITYKLTSDGRYQFVSLECASRFSQALEDYFYRGEAIQPVLKKVKEMLEKVKKLNEDDYKKMKEHVKKNMRKWAEKYPDLTDLYLVSVGKDQGLERKLVEKAKKENIPILIRREDKYSIYGCCNGKWEERKLDLEKIYQVSSDNKEEEVQKKHRKNLTSDLEKLPFEQGIKNRNEVSDHLLAAMKYGHTDSKLFKGMTLEILKDLTDGLPNEIRDILLDSFQLKSDLYFLDSQLKVEADAEAALSLIKNILPNSIDLLGEDVSRNLDKMTEAFTLSDIRLAEYDSVDTFFNLFTKNQLVEMNLIPTVALNLYSHLVPFISAIIAKQEELEKAVVSKNYNVASVESMTKNDEDSYIKLIREHWEKINHEILNPSSNMELTTLNQIVKKIDDLKRLKRELRIHQKRLSVHLEQNKIESPFIQSNLEKIYKNLTSNIKKVNEDALKIINDNSIKLNRILNEINEIEENSKKIRNKLVDNLNKIKEIDFSPAIHDIDYRKKIDQEVENILAQNKAMLIDFKKKINDKKKEFIEEKEQWAYFESMGSSSEIDISIIKNINQYHAAVGELNNKFNKLSE
ncbi:MAG: hypothetical protein KIT56_02185, partial [Gammaproteobacteria bacterium]|nr:hypothetical protein [Gammaproteobacteria bacterium]